MPSTVFMGRSIALRERKGKIQVHLTAGGDVIFPDLYMSPCCLTSIHWGLIASNWLLHGITPDTIQLKDLQKASMIDVDTGAKKKALPLEMNRAAG